MSKAARLIDYILKHTDLNQADLARKLKVSRAQISKWKAGDYLSSERTTELLSLAGLFDTANEEWAMFAKTKENAEAWYSYIFEILEDVEWGRLFKEFFQDMPDIYVGHLIIDLCDIGATIEQRAPTTRWIDEEACESTPLASALFSVLEIWGQLHDWIDDTLEFEDLTDDAESDIFDLMEDLRFLVFDLALEHVETDELTAIGVDTDKLKALIEKSREKIKSHFHEICIVRLKHGLPITEDYFQLLHLHPEELAEQSWFRPNIHNVNDENIDDLIKSYLPYGQRLILTHLEYSARALRHLDEKLDRIAEKLSPCN
jgi:transcriptional regulator with XRE-family HTH domain